MVSAIRFRGVATGGLVALCVAAQMLCRMPAALECHAADNATPEQLRFFESQIRPLLITRCLGCHGAQKHEGGLRLDSLAAMLKGGDSGEGVVVPGKPDESLLVEAIRYQSLQMPPKERLPEPEVDLLVKWVAAGAFWPGKPSDTVVARDSDKITDEDRNWWAFRPVRAIAPPVAADDGWSRTEIDRFIRHAHQANGVLPAPEADRVALIRRIYFDLIGLPPTPAEVAAYIADESAQAYERVVDGLLARPEYGERWARHWLDLVRYADSDGYKIDQYRPHAWRYRDYVIGSFNEDKPYDRFVQEQIAGDELFPGDPAALVATGYLRHGIYDYSNTDARGQWAFIQNDITDNVSDVFLGLGMQCARCHDHKFDPLLQKDYYRLQAFFAPLVPRDDLTATTDFEHAQYLRAFAPWEEQTAELRRQISEIEAPYRDRAAKSAIEKFPEDVQAAFQKPPAERTPLDIQIAGMVERQVVYEFQSLDKKLKGEDKEQLLALRKELSQFDELRPAPLPVALAATDVGPQAPPTFVPGCETEPIEPGFPAVLGLERPHVEGSTTSTGRRAALARWLSSADNPLTTRVIVNRVWQYHFGRGLAANSSDFGRLGGPPSHPELLDWLTNDFVRNGWSLKRLHRLIVTSAVYRQSTAHPQYAELVNRDPENRWYWRGDTRRLDAEQIRDAMLAVTGQLSSLAGGPGVDGDAARRSIYTRFMRNVRDPLLDVFDLPLFFLSTAARDTTTTPIQSLHLLNSQTMLRHAGRLAERAWSLDVGDVAETTANSLAAMDLRIDRLWRLVYGRPPRGEESRLAREFLDRQSRRIAPEQAASQPDVATGKVPYHDGQALVIDPTTTTACLSIADDKRLALADFTIEAYFQVRSVFDSGNVRTLVSKWSGDTAQPGWRLGITGRGSRRKPQTLALQICGAQRDGQFGEAALFSDQQVELNRPYYVAVSVRRAGPEPGQATFYLKDLSNDDEPLGIAAVSHEISGGFANHHPLTIGACTSQGDASFDGLVDDVRLSCRALNVQELLCSSEQACESTVGYWQFEVEPGVFHDTSENRLDIVPVTVEFAGRAPLMAAFVDLCHALLNSNEFLYVN